MYIGAGKEIMLEKNGEHSARLTKIGRVGPTETLSMGARGGASARRRRIV